MIDHEQIARLLGHTEIFAGLSDEYLLAVAKVTKLVEFEPKTCIVRQGDPGNELYLIASGTVSVLVEDRDLGIEHPVLELGANQSFGEMSLLTEAPRSATVRTKEPCLCVALAKSSFDSLLQKLPQVAVVLSRYLAQRLHRQVQLTGFRFVSFEDLKFDQEIYGLIPGCLLRRLQAVPLKLEGHTLSVALTRPNDPAILDALKQAVPGLGIEPLACAQEDYVAFEEQVLSRFDEREAAPVVAAAPERLTWPDGRAVESPLSKLLSRALGSGVDQVLVEPWHEGPCIRWSCDGELEAVEDEVCPEEEVPALLGQLIERLDEGGGLSASSGVVGLKADDTRLELKLSLLQTRQGPRISLELVDASRAIPSLSTLVPSQSMQALVRTALARPGKATLVVGPRGSGRSTTLYSLMRTLVEEGPEQNLVTLEKRPLLGLERVAQVTVENDFDDLLKAAVAQRPHLLMVDEPETPEAFRACLDSQGEGLSLLTTVKCEGAFQSLVELRKWGCGPAILAGNVELIVGQRLMRRICEDCRVEKKPSGPVLAQLARSHMGEKGDTFFAGAGCASCQGTGYRGRVACFEALRVNDFLAEIVANDRPAESIRKAALSQNLLVGVTDFAKVLLRLGWVAPTEALRLYGSGSA